MAANSTFQGSEARTWNWKVLAAAVAVLSAVTGGILAALTIGDGENSAAGVGVVEAMFETYNREGPAASLRYFSSDEAARFRDHMDGLAVWNDRLTFIEPCQETRIDTIVCVMAEQHDLHEAAGLPPYANTFTLRVNEAGEISYVSQSVPDHFRTYYAFRSRFTIWLLDAHPEEAARIAGWPGVYQGPSAFFDADSATAALEFVDEFVAQSTDYPPGD